MMLMCPVKMSKPDVACGLLVGYPGVGDHVHLCLQEQS